MSAEANDVNAGSETPTVAQLLDSVDENDFDSDFFQINFEKQVRKKSLESEIKFVHLTGLKDHYDQKKKWSIFLMTSIGFLLIFQSVLLLMVGFSWWDFTKYEWLLPALLAQNLAQVIGLAIVVVKSLFRDIGFDEHKKLE